MADNRDHRQENGWGHPYGRGCAAHSRRQRYAAHDWFPDGRVAGCARLRAVRWDGCRAYRQVRLDGKSVVMTMPMSHISCQGAPSARAQRGSVAAASSAVLLCLADLGFFDARAIAQEFVGQHRWRTAIGPTVLTLEEEKAAKPGSEFEECANGCPVMIV